MASKPFIPVATPDLNGSEARNVASALRSGWISSQGDYLQAFEASFGRYIGRRFAVATTSGTTALHLALVALGAGPGDEILIPDFTMVACAFAVCQTGATPVFVDASPDTWTLNPEKLRAKITSRTRGIMAVHIYGHPADMGAIQHVADQYKLWVLEDAAEAHGALYQKRKCGALSTIAAFSFYANKILTTGEGGMVVTDDESLYKRCLSFKNLCFPLGAPRDYLHHDIGFNYRMTNVQAAIGVAQLKRISSLIQARRTMAKRYLKRLKHLPGIQFPVEKPWAKNVYWMFGIVLDDSVAVNRNEVMTRLRAAGIDSRPFFQGMHRQPALRKAGIDLGGEYPVSDRLADRGFYLPSSGTLTEKQIDRIGSSLEEALKPS